jgi:hypothetical protein
MIDLANEQRIGLHEAAKLYPSFRNDRPTHVSTVLRHITKGVRSSNCETVHLEGARLGGRWITSVEAVQRFMERLTTCAVGNASNASAPSIRTTARRLRELAEADAELDRAGI